MTTIKCSIPLHNGSKDNGYDPNKADNPEKADLRVSNDFSIKSSYKIAITNIKCSTKSPTAKDISFRIREDMHSSTDHNGLRFELGKKCAVAGIGDKLPNKPPGYGHAYVSSPKTAFYWLFVSSPRN